MPNISITYDSSNVTIFLNIYCRNPTPTTNAVIHNKWEPVQSKEMEYLFIGGGVHNGKNMYAERLKFWHSLPIYSKVYHPKDEL